MGKKDLKALDQCRVAGCGLERREHTAGEMAHTINHEFSTDGRLTVLERNKPPARDRGNTQRSSGMVKTATAGGDPVLRFILINKGIITTDELDEAERVLRSTGLLGPTLLPREPGLGRAAPDA